VIGEVRVFFLKKIKRKKGRKEEREEKRKELFDLVNI
jgi:hypothetical protein